LVQDFKQEAMISVGENVSDIFPQQLKYRSSALWLESCFMMGIDDEKQGRCSECVDHDRFDHLQAGMLTVDNSGRSAFHQEISADWLCPRDRDAQVPVTALVIGVDFCARCGERTRVLGALEHLSQVHAPAHLVGCFYCRR